jgi:hypothetical protein
MTKPWRVDVLQCRGSSYDVGKQMAEGFLKTARGSAFHRRKGHQPFGFVLKDAQAALCTYAPNIWEELHGLADGLKIPLERAAAEYSNSRLSFPKRGCSSVMTKALYGRNYNYSPRRYDPILVAIQPKGVHASLGFSDRFTGRVDGMNEHGLCVGLHFVNFKPVRPGLAAVRAAMTTLWSNGQIEGQITTLKPRRPEQNRASLGLGDSIASSTRMRFSVRTTLPVRRYKPPQRRYAVHRRHRRTTTRRTRAGNKSALPRAAQTMAVQAEVGNPASKPPTAWQLSS